MEIDLLNTYAVCGQEHLEGLYELDTVTHDQQPQVEAASARHGVEAAAVGSR
jgi:hypothetical protein